MKTPANKITPRMFYDHAIRREYMSDNVKLIHSRLGMGMAKFKNILQKNIRCENALTYDFSFE